MVNVKISKPFEHTISDNEVEEVLPSLNDLLLAQEDRLKEQLLKKSTITTC